MTIVSATTTLVKSGMQKIENPILLCAFAFHGIR